MSDVRDHGGGLDIAIKEYGSVRNNWIDLSTGINPNHYSIPKIPNYFWNTLPDSEAQNSMLKTARLFWNVPKNANIIASSGVSQLIAIMPNLLPAGKVEIISPTYNEHAAAFKSNGWKVGSNGNVRILVNPNNPNGKHHPITEEDSNNYDLIIIDESFCDVTPEKSLIHLTKQKNVIVLKGLGKFWGLAGLRLGFAIAAPELIESINKLIGPRILVNPNNPNGKHHPITEEDSNNYDLIIIDESFCDVTPEKSLIHLTKQKNVIVLKGLGKFWGLAGLRLGFAIAAPELIESINKLIGPWAISGPAQFIGKAALSDINWISDTRLKLKVNSERLDQIMISHNIKPIGGTDLFRLFEVKDANRIQIKLAKSFIWTRIFPYSTNWLRLGIPKNDIEFERLSKALEE